MNDQLAWSEYRPSQFSLIQVGSDGSCYEIRGGNSIPVSGEFRIELEDGTYIERKVGEGSEFSLYVPNSRGYDQTTYRRSSHGIEWTSASSQGGTIEAAQNTVARNKSAGFKTPAISLSVFERLVSVCLFVLLFWHVFIHGNAVKKDESFAPQILDQSMDTSDEYVPQSDQPLKVRTEG